MSLGQYIAVNLLSKQQEIVRAIQQKDLNRFNEAGSLDSETDLEFEITANGITPLMLAASVGYTPILNILLENHAVNKSCKDKEGFNSVYYAAFYGNIEALNVLKQYDSAYDVSNAGTTPLHGAVRQGH